MLLSDLHKILVEGLVTLFVPSYKSSGLVALEMKIFS